MTDIPKKQKAAVYDKPGTVSTKVTEIDVPEPGQGEVLINLYVNKPYPEQPANKYHRTHSGVCHSDFGIMMNSVCQPDSNTALN